LLLIKVGLQAWKRQPLLQLVFAVAFGALALGGSALFALDRGMKPLVKGHMTERTVSLYLEAGSDPAAVQQVVDQVRAQVGSSPRVRVMDRRETIERLEKDHPSLAKELAALAPREIQALVPESVMVEGQVETAAVSKLGQIEGVERVEWVAGKYRQAASALQAFRWILRAMMAAFGLAALILCLQISRTQKGELKGALKVIRSSGARLWQMAIPGMVAGSVSGLIAGGAAAVGWGLALRPAFTSVRGLSLALSAIAEPSTGGALMVFVACVLLAAASGALTTALGERGRA
jgi:cell division protein FtsX